MDDHSDIKQLVGARTHSARDMCATRAMPAIRAFRGYGALAALLPVVLAAGVTRGSAGTAFVGAEALQMPGRLLCERARVRTGAAPTPLTALAVCQGRCGRTEVLTGARS